ncbi:MAG: hypothetical protein LBC50_01690 [Candidatus Ancillula sp.]|jgi:DNA polymerase-1|nr:hypothetical protein [Candidatus Ancillula sp.]
MFEMFENGSAYGEFEDKGKLLLIDGPYSMFRAFYGYSAERFHRKDGVANNCIYGVARTILQLLHQEKPTHIAFAYDVSREGHRRELLPTYKDGRKKTPEDLVDQFPSVREMLEYANIDVLEKRRFEADDIIATLSTEASNLGWDVRIFSSDRDMYQLVDNHVHILRPCTKNAGLEVMTPEAVRKRYGVDAKQYPELQALIGEAADNIPGVPGVGPKTALKWILEYESLENLLNNAEEIPGKIGDALREHSDQVLLNRKLNHLVRDVPLNKTVQDLRLKSPNESSLNKFFEEWEMPSMMKSFKW